MMVCYLQVGLDVCLYADPCNEAPDNKCGRTSYLLEF